MRFKPRPNGGQSPDIKPVNLTHGFANCSAQPIVQGTNAILSALTVAGTTFPLVNDGVAYKANTNVLSAFVGGWRGENAMLKVCINEKPSFLPFQKSQSIFKLCFFSIFLSAKIFRNHPWSDYSFHLNVPSLKVINRHYIFTCFIKDQKRLSYRMSNSSVRTYSSGAAID